jgi:protein-S-isoprenylcysteine O-methyltransferase Ste14
MPQADRCRGHYDLGQRGMNVAVPVIWIAFGLYWLAAATRAKASAPVHRARFPGLLIIVWVALRLAFGGNTLAVHSVPLRAVGIAVLVAGLGLAVYARVYLGSNWGMPMTVRAEPELVTAGPYRFVRHPIYTGILLGLVGTALALNLSFFLGVVVLGAYFAYSARIEERNLAETFGPEYGTYRARTKMIVPFLL